MKRLLENVLEKNSPELYTRYKAIKNLLRFIAERNNFTVEDQYMIMILSSFLKDEKLDLNNNSFIDELTNFFDKIIDLYNKGEERRYKLLLDKKVLQPEVKEWLKEEKYSVIKIIDYYYNTAKSEMREEVYKNEYFQIERVKKRYNSKYLITMPNSTDMVIRLVIKGQIYYKNGILLSEGEYLITDKNYQLSQHKLLTKHCELITITLKKKFLDEFSIKNLNEIIQIKSTIPLEYFKRVLDRKFIEENMSLFIELLTLVLQVNNLLPNKVVDINRVEDFEIRDFLFEIEENIKLSDEEIKEKLFNKFYINNSKLEEIIGKYYEMTFKKYILNLKIKHIMNEYYNGNKNINKLISDYRITNNNNFYYNLKKYFGISIKELRNKI